jgi:hypothetical protein
MNYRLVTGVAALLAGIRSYEALISLILAAKVWVWWGSGIMMGAFRGATKCLKAGKLLMARGK